MLENDKNHIYNMRHMQFWPMVGTNYEQKSTPGTFQDDSTVHGCKLIPGHFIFFQGGA